MQTKDAVHINDGKSIPVWIRSQGEFLSNGSLFFLGLDTVGSDISTKIRKRNVFNSPGVEHQGNFSGIF